MVTEKVPITLAKGKIVAGTAKYQEPVAKGTGTVPVSCTTQLLVAGLGLQGKIVSTLKLALVKDSASRAGSAPSTYTVTSTNETFPAGETVTGAPSFVSTKLTECTTTPGRPSAKVQGVLVLGSAP